LAVNELEFLKSVSRSFYISIRLLPRPLRQPVALAYLLARTSDTIADSSAVNVEKRIELLDRFARAVARKEEDFGEELKQILVSKHGSSRPASGRRNTVPQPSGAPEVTESERALLESAEIVLRWLENLSSEDQRDVRELLAIITRGQQQDLARLADGLKALANADELREDTCLFSESSEFYCPNRNRYAGTRDKVRPRLAVGKYLARCGQRFARRPLLLPGKRIAGGWCFSDRSGQRSAAVSANLFALD
jgi:hypothetical protein